MNFIVAILLAADVESMCDVLGVWATIAMTTVVVVIGGPVPQYITLGQGLNSVEAGGGWNATVSLELPHLTYRLPLVQLQLPYGCTSMSRSR